MIPLKYLKLRFLDIAMEVKNQINDISEEYNIALAYSNYPSLDNLPTIVSGVVTTNMLLTELSEKNLPRKNLLMRRKNKFYDLKTAFDDASDYLTGYELSAIFVKEQDQIEKRYELLLNLLMKVHIQDPVKNINSIVIRGIERYDKNTNKMIKVSFSERFLNLLLKIVGKSDNIKILEPNSDDRLLNVARTHASSEHLRLKSKDRRFVLEEIGKNPNQFFQILKIGWNSPPVDIYSNYNVGPPSIIIRNSNPEQIEHLYLSIGSRISFVPLARFCRGKQKEKKIMPCKEAKPHNPFGWQMLDSGSENCPSCRNTEGYDVSLCLYRKPLCNGFDVKCGNHYFAGNVCCNLFGLYVTRFGNTLKVGTAFLPNIIGRLLEQGASSALILYPIQGILNVYTLEKEVKNFLKDKIKELEPFGISKVFIRSPPSDEKLRYFLYNDDSDGLDIFHKIKNILDGFETEIDGFRINLDEASFSYVDFRKNYSQPPKELERIYLKSKPVFGSFNGRIVGYRGSFVYLDTGKVIDLKKLQGYVVRGKSNVN